MAYQSIWYFTNLPKDIVEILEKDLEKSFDGKLKPSVLGGDHINENIRNSKNSWIPTNHWIGGFIWHYVQKANRTNFLYDLSHIDGEAIQYTKYGVGDYYNWHLDSGLDTYYKPIRTEQSAEGSLDNNDEFLINSVKINCEIIRKLSFSIQLSDPDDYEGGNLQLMDEHNKSYIAPRQRGSIILFDSRTPHRVHKVRKGERKSLVGWVVGPRWK